jgi:hypothetical protein
VSRWAKGDLRQSFRFNIRFDMDLRGRSGGVYPRSGLRIEPRREVDNGLVIGFGFENVCSDEKVGKLQVRVTKQRAVDWAGAEGLTGECESHATGVSRRACNGEQDSDRHSWTGTCKE